MKRPSESLDSECPPPTDEVPRHASLVNMPCCLGNWQVRKDLLCVLVQAPLVKFFYEDVPRRDVASIRVLTRADVHSAAWRNGQASARTNR